MKPCHAFSSGLSIVAICVALCHGDRAIAQQRALQPPPQIGYVYPAGGQAGSTFTVTIGGRYLAGVKDIHISGSGVQVTKLESFQPLTPQQARALAQKLQELTRKKNKSAEDLKQIAEIRNRLMTFNVNANPNIAETVTFQITIAQNAVIGERELRVATDTALSNPRIFSIGQLPEVSKKVAQFSNEGNFRNQRRGEQEPAPPSPEMTITIPCVINGQILPSQADRYRFKARRGQRLVITTSARELTPYLPDAVPGWFQAVLTLYDARGNELAFNDDFRFNPDPVLYYEIPQDGEYVLEVRDAIYRGREDFVYRITISETPFVTGIFPLGGLAGTETPIQLRGWNLPVTTVTQDKNCRPGVFPVFVAKDGWLSNRLPFVVDTMPQAAEKESNDDIAHAQPVSWPVVVNGRIDHPNDRDLFRIQGRAGTELVVEVQARRLNSPLDSVLRITDAAGKQLAANDDHEDKAAGLNTHHAASYLRVKLPATGDYFVHLTDAQRKGGPEYAYRLRISPPIHDFELRVVPSSINLRAGGTTALTVYALRKDGFQGDILLSLKNAPEGFKLGGGCIPAGQDRVRVTITAPPTPTTTPINIAIEGRARLGNQLIVREAVPADDMMQAFAYHHLVPARELKVVVAESKLAARKPVPVVEIAPVKIPAGGTTKIHLGAPVMTFFGKVQLELDDPPDGITIKDVTTNRDSTEILLATDAEKLKPGMRGNLIVSAYAPLSRGKQQNQTRIPLGTLPAIPFEVVAR
ncbi:MAG: PPC domain-containing protein [Verrucomicrobiae bacterium]|nr:PPC domain-containing protein [Verrucomicrobiae bacterium]